MFCSVSHCPLVLLYLAWIYVSRPRTRRHIVPPRVRRPSETSGAPGLRVLDLTKMAKWTGWDQLNCRHTTLLNCRLVFSNMHIQKPFRICPLSQGTIVLLKGHAREVEHQWSQMGEVQGGTPTWTASQVIDSGSPPPVIRRRAVLSQGHVPRAAAAGPKFIRDMQVTLGTAPNVDISQMTTIPGDVQVGAPSQMSMAPRTFFGYPWSSKPCSSVSASVTEEMQQEMRASQGSELSMQDSSEFERSRSRELGRQLAIVPTGAGKADQKCSSCATRASAPTGGRTSPTERRWLGWTCFYWLAKSQVKGEFKKTRKTYAASEVAKVTSLWRAWPGSTHRNCTIKKWNDISPRERDTSWLQALLSDLRSRVASAFDCSRQIFFGGSRSLVPSSLPSTLVPSSSCRCPGSRPLGACRKTKEWMVILQYRLSRNTFRPHLAFRTEPPQSFLHCLTQCIFGCALTVFFALFDSSDAFFGCTITVFFALLDSFFACYFPDAGGPVVTATSSRLTPASVPRSEICCRLFACSIFWVLLCAKPGLS